MTAAQIRLRKPYMLKHLEAMYLQKPITTFISLPHYYHCSDNMSDPMGVV